MARTIETWVGRTEADDIQVTNVRTVDRVVSILDAFVTRGGTLGVAELSRTLGLGKGTVYRLLSAMQGHRLVEQDLETRRYRLGMKLAEYGNSVIKQLDYPKLAEPHLRTLVAGTNETVHLAVLDNGKVFYVAKVEGARALRMPSQVGASNPAHSTGVGKALLASLSADDVMRIVEKNGLPRFTKKTIVTKKRLREELAVVRARGYAIDDEELEEGLRCVAAPIVNHTGRAVAAVSLSGPAGRIPISGESGAHIARLVMETGAAISKEFGAPSLRAAT